MKELVSIIKRIALALWVGRVVKGVLIDYT
jgi:hypothetical protein